MTAFCGLAQNFSQLFIYRVGVGVGEACTGPSTFSMLADLFPRDKLARANAVLQFGIMAGSAAALIIGGSIVTLLSGVPPIEVPVIGTIHGWQLTFFLIGIPGLVVALLIRTVPEPKRRGLVHGKAVPIGEVARFMLANISTYGLLFLGLGSVTVLLIGVQSWTPTFFIRTYGWTAGEYGLLAGVAILLLQPPGAMVGSYLAERFAKAGHDDANVRVGLIAAVLVLPGYVLFPLVSNQYLSMALVMYTFFIGGWPGRAAECRAADDHAQPDARPGHGGGADHLQCDRHRHRADAGGTVHRTRVPFGRRSGLALAVTSAILGPIAIIAYWFARKPYAGRVAESRKWP